MLTLGKKKTIVTQDCFRALLIGAQGWDSYVFQRNMGSLLKTLSHGTCLFCAYFGSWWQPLQLNRFSKRSVMLGLMIHFLFACQELEPAIGTTMHSFFLFFKRESKTAG